MTGSLKTYFIIGLCGRLWAECLTQDVATDTVTAVAQDLIGPSPVHQAVLKGTNHALQCTKVTNLVTGKVAWIELLSDSSIIVFIESEKQTLLPKYENFRIVSDDVHNWNLHIDNMSPNDEGKYACTLTSTGESHSAARTVEVQANYFDISLDDGTTPDNILSIDGDPREFTCTTINARPALNLLWFHKTSTERVFTQILSGFVQETTTNVMDNATYDTTNVLKYTMHKEYHKGQLKCQTTGQSAIPTDEDVINFEVHWEPEVNVLYKSLETLVVCESESNPPVIESGYTILIYGKDYQGSSLRIDIKEETEVTCIATNIVGTGRASKIFKGEVGSGPRNLPSVSTILAVLAITLAVYTDVMH